MKVLIINVVCGIRSTGRICTELAVELEKQGHEVKIAYGREEVPDRYQKYAVRIGNDLDVRVHALKSRLLDQSGFGSIFATKKFIRWAEAYNPDLLWLNNLHGYYINIEELFAWIKLRPQMKTVWTLHDCWAFTGHCAYFSFINCKKWMCLKNDNLKGCYNCPQKSQYPKSYVDNSKTNFIRKRKAFSNVKNLKIITPSKWLKDTVSDSFLGDYPISVINNCINSELFKITHSNFKEEYGIKDKKMILGVANVWEPRKGLEDYIELSFRLDEEKKFQIVLVGLSAKQIKEIHDRNINILALPVADGEEKLAKIYSAADVFLNLTKEDNYPTVNLEARACGLRVVTYNTGGSPEAAGDNGIVVERGDIEGVIKGIQTAIKDVSMKNNSDISINVISKNNFINDYLSCFLE